MLATGSQEVSSMYRVKRRSETISLWKNLEFKMVEQTSAAGTPADRAKARKVARSFIWFADHWVLVFCVLWGVLMVLPFFAPVFMRLGWTAPAQAVYFIYSFLCHQMA